MRTDVFCVSPKYVILSNIILTFKREDIPTLASPELFPLIIKFVATSHTS